MYLFHIIDSVFYEVFQENLKDKILIIIIPPDKQIKTVYTPIQLILFHGFEPKDITKTYYFFFFIIIIDIDILLSLYNIIQKKKGWYQNSISIY